MFYLMQTPDGGFIFAALVILIFFVVSFWFATFRHLARLSRDVDEMKAEIRRYLVNRSTLTPSVVNTVTAAEIVAARSIDRIDPESVWVPAIELDQTKTILASGAGGRDAAFASSGRILKAQTHPTIVPPAMPQSNYPDTTRSIPPPPPRPSIGTVSPSATPAEIAKHKRDERKRQRQEQEQAFAAGNRTPIVEILRDQYDRKETIK